MKKIKGYPMYFVNDKGDVFTTKNVRKTKLGQPVPEKLKGTVDNRGLVRYTLYNEHGRETVYGHEIVMRSFNVRRPKEAVIVHLDGDSENNKLGNLRFATRSEFSKFVKTKDPNDVKRYARQAKKGMKIIGNKLYAKKGNAVQQADTQEKAVSKKSDKK